MQTNFTIPIHVSINVDKTDSKETVFKKIKENIDLDDLKIDDYNLIYDNEIIDDFENFYGEDIRLKLSFKNIELKLNEICRDPDYETNYIFSYINDNNYKNYLKDYFVLIKTTCEYGSMIELYDLNENKYLDIMLSESENEFYSCQVIDKGIDINIFSNRAEFYKNNDFFCYHCNDEYDKVEKFLNKMYKYIMEDKNHPTIYNLFNAEEDEVVKLIHSKDGCLMTDDIKIEIEKNLTIFEEN